MKERRERKMFDILLDEDINLAIEERFKMERQGFDNVDGEDRWALDLFDEEEEC